MMQRTHQAIPPASNPQPDCSWCWYARNNGVPFPPAISSSCCPEHRAWLVAQLTEKRAARGEKRGQS